MNTNGITQIEMETMHAIIGASESLASIAESLKKTVQPVILSEEMKEEIFKEVALKRAYEFIEENYTPEETQKFHELEEEILDAFNVWKFQLDAILEGHHVFTVMDYASFNY